MRALPLLISGEVEGEGVDGGVGGTITGSERDTNKGHKADQQSHVDLVPLDPARPTEEMPGDHAEAACEDAGNCPTACPALPIEGAPEGRQEAGGVERSGKRRDPPAGIDRSLRAIGPK